MNPTSPPAPQCPVRWDRPVEPSDLDTTLRLVRGGAQAAGGRAAAAVAVDPAELRRRGTAGLGAVTSLVLLDSLMSLPWESPVRLTDIAADVRRRLASAPYGVVECDGPNIRRLIRPPLTVVAVLVEAGGWRRPMRAVAPFAPFAQRIVVLGAPPRRGEQVLWEARLEGIGVWVKGDDRIDVLVPPAPFHQLLAKAAGWRFAERAYGTLTANDLLLPQPVPVGHRSCTGCEGSRPQSCLVPQC